MNDLDDLKNFMSQDAPPATVAPTAPPGASGPAANPSPDPGLAALHSFMAPELNQEQYGTLPQQALAGLEGVARGASLGTSDLAETGLGISTPEAIKGREEANPVTSGLGAFGGGAGLLALTGGLSAPAEAVAGGAGLGATLLSSAGEGAAFGAGSAVSDYALGDPNLNASKVATDIGLGAVLGLGAGALAHGVVSAFGKMGAVKGSASDAIAGEAAAANNAVGANAESIAPPDVPSPDVAEAAENLGLPVVSGMGSENPWVQKGVDALVSGAPSYSGVKYANLYADAYNGLISKIGEIIPETNLSKAAAGQIVQDGLSSKIAEEYEPIQQLYSAIREVTPNIPLSDRSAPAIARNILRMPEILQTPNSPQARLAQAVAENIQNAKTVEDISFQKSAVKGMANSTIPAERRIAAILSDKLNDWEESSILRYANGLKNGLADADPEKQAIFQPVVDKISDLLPQIKAAKAQYRPFIEDVGTLSEQLGKAKVHGPQDALDFIRNLDFEQVTNRLTGKNNSQFRAWFAEKFPQEMAVLRQYQKGALREAASKTGTFSPKVFFNQLNSLEPEIQRSIFFPDELAKLQYAETYLRHAFPKNFNPSGTSGMSAFREFFNSPTGAILGNARDLGIEAFIKAAGALPEASRPSPLEVGQEAAQKFNAMNAVKIMSGRVDQKINAGINAILGTKMDNK